MHAFSCPHCGAPAPPQVPPGLTTLTCAYCKQSYPAPLASQPPYSGQMQGPPSQGPQSQQIPQIVIMHTHASYDHSAYQVANAVNWGYWIFRGVVPLVVVLIVAGSSVAMSLAGKSKMASSLVWDGTAPFSCDGVDEYAVTGVTATFNAGSAITASGNCHFTCTDCNIKAPTAISADGNAVVTIINGSIVGTQTLADASDNARVNVNGNVTASGEVKQASNARVSAPKPAAAATQATATSTAGAKAGANVPGTPAATPAAPKPAVTSTGKPAAPAGSSRHH